MKKYLFTSALCFVTVFSFAQKKEVNKALNAARLETPNIEVARNAINLALKSDETKNQEKTYYVAGLIEEKQFDLERNVQLLGKTPNNNILYPALLNSVIYYIKAAELGQLPDEKGKIKPQYLKEIKKSLKANQSNLFNAGAVFYDAKDYQKAYDAWDLYLKIPYLPYMPDMAETVPADTNFVKIKYYKALAARELSSKLAIDALEAVKNDGFNENTIYQLLSDRYSAEKDTANLIRTYKEGVQKFPKEPFFIQNLIALYINTEKYQEALDYLNQATENTPNDPQLWNVKGSVYEKLEKLEGFEAKAMQCYEKAVEIDPNYADAIGNIGRIFYNKAILLREDNNEIKDNKKYNQGLETIVNPAFKKALPYLEKAHQMQPDKRDWKLALRGTYYSLNMGKELEAIEKELNE